MATASTDPNSKRVVLEQTDTAAATKFSVTLKAIIRTPVNDDEDDGPTPGKLLKTADEGGGSAAGTGPELQQRRFRTKTHVMLIESSQAM